MPSGIDKNGEYCCMKEKVVKAKIAAHKDKSCTTNKFNAAIELVVNSLDGWGDLCPADSWSKLSDTFHMEREKIDKNMLSAALLNIDVDSLVHDLEQDRIGPALSRIWYRINAYLPDDLKTSYRSFQTLNACETNRQNVREFIFFIIQYILKIEDRMTSNYYYNGTKQCIDILERRFKKEWAKDNKTTSITQTFDDKNKLEIVIIEK